jgi:hypothetical protein
MVVEDGRKICLSESAAEYSDHGEEFSDSDIIIYPPEIDEVMDAVKAGRWNMLPVDRELMGQEIAIQRAGRERKGSLVCRSYDEAFRSIPAAGQWMA